MSEEIASADALLAALARSEDARNALLAENARLRTAIERALTLLPGLPEQAEAVLERARLEQS